MHWKTGDGYHPPQLQTKNDEGMDDQGAVYSNRRTVQCCTVHTGPACTADSLIVGWQTKLSGTDEAESTE